MTLVCSERLGAELSRDGMASRRPAAAAASAACPAIRRAAAGISSDRGHASETRPHVGFTRQRRSCAAFLDAMLGVPLRELKRELGDRLEARVLRRPARDRARARCAVPAVPGRVHDVAPSRARTRARRRAGALFPTRRSTATSTSTNYLSTAPSVSPESLERAAERGRGARRRDRAPVRERSVAWLAALRRSTGDPALRARIAQAAWSTSRARFSPRCCRRGRRWRRCFAHRAPQVEPEDVRCRADRCGTRTGPPRGLRSAALRRTPVARTLTGQLRQG